MANRIENVSRRGFLGTVLSAGAFVLGVRCGGTTEYRFDCLSGPRHQPSRNWDANLCASGWNLCRWPSISGNRLRTI